MHSFQRLYRFQRRPFKLNHPFAYCIHNMYQIVALETQFRTWTTIHEKENEKYRSKPMSNRFTRYVSIMLFMRFCIKTLVLLLLLFALLPNLSNPNTSNSLVQFLCFFFINYDLRWNQKKKKYINTYLKMNTGQCTTTTGLFYSFFVILFPHLSHLFLLHSSR